MKVKKVVNLIFSLALGFTVYYAFSCYSGSRKMIEYDVWKQRNEKDIHALDSLEIVLAKRPYDVKLQKMLAEQKMLAQKEQVSIEKNKVIGTGVYGRRLIKLYCELGVLILSSIAWLYLRKKDNEV